MKQYLNDPIPWRQMIAMIAMALILIGMVYTIPNPVPARNCKCSEHLSGSKVVFDGNTQSQE